MNNNVTLTKILCSKKQKELGYIWCAKCENEVATAQTSHEALNKLKEKCPKATINFYFSN